MTVMKERLILGLLLLICSSGCHLTKKEVTLNNAFPLCGNIAMEDAILADTLFHGSCPVLYEGTEYVYLVNAECSYCIAKALDCYHAFLSEKLTSPFLFLSRTEDHEIFEDYFKKRFSVQPSVFDLQEHLDCGDGVFLIHNGRVRARMEWH